MEIRVVMVRGRTWVLGHEYQASSLLLSIEYCRCNNPPLLLVLILSLIFSSLYSPNSPGKGHAVDALPLCMF